VSEPLSEVIASLPEGEDLDLDEVLDRFGARAHGTALLLLGLPDAIPLPVPSLGAILGPPLALVSLHLAVFGDGGHRPSRLRRWRLPARWVALMKRYVNPYLAKAERITQTRWSALARRQRLVGLVCLALSLVLVLPIPFMNTPPSLCLVLLAWGIVQRDGAFVLAGLAATLALGVALALLAGQLMELVA
jgi:hypothetical protein